MAFSIDDALLPATLTAGPMTDLIWADLDGRGVTTESSTGFVLPDGARRSPDAGWIENSRIPADGAPDLDEYWHTCPNFVIELKSRTDRLPTLREKMEEWISSGVSLGWLIDPETRTVEIYRPGRDPESLKNPDRVRGEGPVEGFTLDLKKVWNPLPRSPAR
ncbi:MAG: Uma2 family endonuclease [Acidobacteria bacterium]|nr:Uma2 family endonuclease [Acidobacteriota bacterium]